MSVLALPLIVGATREGLVQIPNRMREASHGLGKTRITTIRHVLLPASLPNIVTGLRISLSIAWLVIIAAEMLVGGKGIGYYIWNEWNNLNLASIIVCIVLIGLVGLVLDKLLSAVEKRIKYES